MDAGVFYLLAAVMKFALIAVILAQVVRGVQWLREDSNPTPLRSGVWTVSPEIRNMGYSASFLQAAPTCDSNEESRSLG